MRTSVSKPKVLAVDKEPQRCKLEIQVNKVEQIMKCRLLGTEITSNRALQLEVQNQAHEATIISGCLNDTTWRNKYLRLKTKIRIYISVIRPVLTHSIETRADIYKRNNCYKPQK
jgi:hypothetical protein